MARIFTETFDTYGGTGFASTPGAGQLDSDVFRIAGFSDGAVAYGGTGNSGTDFGRGSIPTDATAAGLYAATVSAGDIAPVVQPTGAEFDAGGFFEARIQNTTGATVSDFDVGFNWVVRNNAPRASDLTLSYSTDGTSFTSVAAGGLTTIGEADG